MADLRVRLFKSDDAEEWDRFCESSPTATFLHTRRFLSYHGQRFRDLSLIVEGGEGWLGLFPAALAADDDQNVVSHPGITFGGVLPAAAVHGELMVDLLDEIERFYRANGYRKLRYKAVPSIYHKNFCQDDLYALARCGFRRYRCDLSATVDLNSRGPVATRRKRGYKKALKQGVTVHCGPEHLLGMWRLLRENLERKYGVSPVHSEQEILMLMERFPREIEFIAAYIEGEMIAGIVLFDSHAVSHSQYVASSAAGNSACALDLVFEYAMDRAKGLGKRYFDFGISTESEGSILNQSLYRFKREFGAGGTVHEFYEKDL